MDRGGGNDDGGNRFLNVFFFYSMYTRYIYRFACVSSSLYLPIYVHFLCIIISSVIWLFLTVMPKNRLNLGKSEKRKVNENAKAEHVEMGGRMKGERETER